MLNRFEKTLISLTVIVLALPFLMLTILLTGRFAEQHRVIAMEIKAADLTYTHSYSLALETLKEAQALAKESSPSQFARISMSLAELAAKMKNFDQALSSYKSAQVAYEDLRKKYRPGGYSGIAATEQLFWVRDRLLSFLIAGGDPLKTMRALRHQIVEIKAVRIKQFNDGVLDFICLQWMESLAKVCDLSGQQIEGNMVRAARRYQVRSGLEDDAILERASIEDPSVARALLSIAAQALVDGDKKKAFRLMPRIYPILDQKRLPKQEVQAFAERYYIELTKSSPAQALEMLNVGGQTLDHLPPVYDSGKALLYANYACVAQESKCFDLAEKLRAKACLEAHATRNKSDLKEFSDKLFFGLNELKFKYPDHKNSQLELVRQGLQLSEQADSPRAIEFACLIVDDGIVANDSRLPADVDKLISLLKHWRGKIATDQMKECIFLSYRLSVRKDLYPKLLETIKTCLDPKDPDYSWQLVRCGYLLGNVPGHGMESERPAFAKAAKLLLDPSHRCIPEHEISVYIHVAQYYLYLEPKIGIEFANRALKLIEREPDGWTKNATELQMLFDSAANNAEFWNNKSYFSFMDRLADLCSRNREAKYGRKSIEYASTLAALAAYRLHRQQLDLASSLNKESLLIFADLNTTNYCFYDLAKQNDAQLKASLHAHP